MNLEKELAVAKEAAVKAGYAIMDVYENAEDMQISYKDGDMPLTAAIVGALFIGIGAGLCVRAGGAPSGDDALAMSICRDTKSDIRIPYLASDLLVLALSLSYLDLKRIAVSLLTVVLSGQLIGFVQNARVPQAEG